MNIFRFVLLLLAVFAFSSTSYAYNVYEMDENGNVTQIHRSAVGKQGVTIAAIAELPEHKKFICVEVIDSVARRIVESGADQGMQSR